MLWCLQASSRAEPSGGNDAQVFHSRAALGQPSVPGLAWLAWAPRVTEGFAGLAAHNQARPAPPRRHCEDVNNGAPPRTVHPGAPRSAAPPSGPASANAANAANAPARRGLDWVDDTAVSDCGASPAHASPLVSIRDRARRSRRPGRRGCVDVRLPDGLRQLPLQCDVERGWRASPLLAAGPYTSPFQRQWSPLCWAEAWWLTAFRRHTFPLSGGRRGRVGRALGAGRKAESSHHPLPHSQRSARGARGHGSEAGPVWALFWSRCRRCRHGHSSPTTTTASCGAIPTAAGLFRDARGGEGRQVARLADLIRRCV